MLISSFIGGIFGVHAVTPLQGMPPPQEQSCTELGLPPDCHGGGTKDNPYPISGGQRSNSVVVNDTTIQPVDPNTLAIARHPNYPIGSIPSKPMSVKFLIEHRSALNDVMLDPDQIAIDADERRAAIGKLDRLDLEAAGATAESLNHRKFHLIRHSQ